MTRTTKLLAVIGALALLLRLASAVGLVPLSEDVADFLSGFVFGLAIAVTIAWWTQRGRGAGV